MIQKENPSDFLFIEDDTINLREEIEKYTYYWKWFVLGITIAAIGAFIYLRYTPNSYEVSATILIDDEKGGGMPSELAAFEELGLMGGKKKVENEIGVLKSRTLANLVSIELDLNISYFKIGRINHIEKYKEDLPFKISFYSKDPFFYNQDTIFELQILDKNSFRISDTDGKSEMKYSFGNKIVTEFGVFTITPLNMIDLDTDIEYLVKIIPLKDVVEYLRKNIEVNAMSKKSDLIELKLKGTVKSKTKDILNELIRQYNEDAIAYKSLVGTNTALFIKERMNLIEKELSKVDKKVEEFKITNELSDIPTEAELILVANSELEKNIIDLNTQLKLADFMMDYMTDNSDQLVPANLGLEDNDVNVAGSRYNQVMLERMRIAKSSGNKNPVIINLDVQLEQLRGSITQGLLNLKTSLEIALTEALEQERKMSARISSVPTQEREYRDIQRQQQIIEALYLFLLEKREENAISLAVTTPNAKLIDSADGSDIPVSPKRKIVVLAAILLGIVIPFGFIYISFLLDNKVHTRKELEDLVKAPFLGDIPKAIDDIKVLLKEDRSSIAEAFRMLRTNMNFMLSNVDGNSKIISITSTIPGEGKTFVSINLATVLAMSNKKVLLIGADIRKPKVAEYLNVPSVKKGLSMFLTDPSIQVPEIIETINETQFDIIQSGIVPPNPSELLMNGRFDEIIAYGKEQYDYVIIDTAPINMVTDTLQLAHHSDLMLYVVRANYIDKRLMEIPKKLHIEKRLPNMALILNGSDATKGYGYGYGYGYGEVDKKKSWFKRK